MVFQRFSQIPTILHAKPQAPIAGYSTIHYIAYSMFSMSSTVQMLQRGIVYSMDSTILLGSPSVGIVANSSYQVGLR